MKLQWIIILLWLLGLGSRGYAQAEPLSSHSKPSLEVVATIKPLHSIIAYLMQGTGISPVLLIENDQSFHGFHPRPATLHTLHQAKLLFYIHEQLEPYITLLARQLPATVTKISVVEQLPLPLRSYRQPSSHFAWNSEANTLKDYHLWLDPLYGVAMAEIILPKLSELFPEHQETLLENFRNFKEAALRLDEELMRLLGIIRSKPFAVFHDAFQYFEYRYHLNSVGVLTLDTEMPITAKNALEIRQKIQQQQVKCVFTEPQFDKDNKVVSLLKDLSVTVAPLDEVGATLPPGAELYFMLLRNTANTMISCLR